MLDLKTYITQGRVCTLVIENIRKHPDLMKKIPQLIDFYSTDEHLFIGSYKIDGINISKSDFRKYESEILDHYKKFGQYCSIQPFDKNSKSRFPSDLTMFESFNKIATYSIMDKIFDFFLETIVFTSNIGWDKFKESYMHYTEMVTQDYVTNGYTDYLFAYVDSGDFSICFDLRKHKVEDVEFQLNRFLQGCE